MREVRVDTVKITGSHTHTYTAHHIRDREKNKKLRTSIISESTCCTAWVTN